MSKVKVSFQLTFVFLLTAAAPIPCRSQSGDQASSLVELKCKIVGGPGPQNRVPWILELRNAAAEPVRRVMKLVGDTVRFKNLVPGIYRVCLTGKGGRANCESVDLVPAPGRRLQEFKKEFRVPESIPGRDIHQIHVLRLAVPSKAKAELQRAEKAQLDGDRAAMIHHLELAIAIYPDYVDAWNNLGACYHQDGDYGRSIEAFRKATELDPEFFPGWLNLASSLLMSGEYRESGEAGGRALNLRPDDASVNSMLALSHYYLHEYSQATCYFRTVLDLDPAFADSPQLYLAHIALAEHATEEAIGYLRSYLKYHPNSAASRGVQQTVLNLQQGNMISEDPVRK